MDRSDLDVGEALAKRNVRRKGGHLVLVADLERDALFPKSQLCESPRYTLRLVGIGATEEGVSEEDKWG